MILRALPFFFLSFILFAARADLTLAPRYEYIGSKDQELANRMIVKGKLNAGTGPFSLSIEGFGEYESNEDQIDIRRTPSRGYLQEAYLEFKLNSFFVRVGRQPLRWSESWTLPSLDVWTGRRWNRLFFDPLSEQLTHPTGVSFAYVRDSFSLDLVSIGELAENTYPFPFSDTALEKKTHFGGRLKWGLGGFSFTALSAQIQNNSYYGLTGNYAFDQFVPKIEMGSKNSETAFGSFGVDMFLGSWVLMPQVSVYEVQGLEQKEINTTIYFSFQWNPTRYDLQVQALKNIKNEDAFFSASCGYNITDNFTLSGFTQNYAGTEGLYKVYQDMTGGPIFGLRAELTGNLVF